MNLTAEIAALAEKFPVGAIVRVPHIDKNLTVVAVNSLYEPDIDSDFIGVLVAYHDEAKKKVRRVSLRAEALQVQEMKSEAWPFVDTPVVVGSKVQLVGGSCDMTVTGELFPGHFVVVYERRGRLCVDSIPAAALKTSQQNLCLKDGDRVSIWDGERSFSGVFKKAYFENVDILVDAGVPKSLDDEFVFGVEKHDRANNTMIIRVHVSCLRKPTDRVDPFGPMNY